jgi:two-component system, NarL family, response regulator DesR
VTTLALIGGQRLLRDATASLLTAQDGLHVLGTFESAAHFLAVAMEDPPAVVLLDCDDDPACWVSAVTSLSSPELESNIVMLCEQVHEEEAIRCAIEHGVSGVVLKSSSPREMREAISYIATGRTVMPVGWQQVPARVGKPLGLTPRHRQILALIARGRGNEEIAAELELSPNTVKFHIRALYSRLGVHNRVEAANRHAQMTDGGA